MANLIHLMPNLEYDEMMYIQSLVKEFDEEKLKQFAAIYNSRRKDPQTILLLTLVGFIGIAGVQRFFLDQIGMGILYLFTGGLCLIGTIVDLVNHKNLTFNYNQKVARQVIAMISG